ncbi:MAG TPA: LuxR C-terminal-related transcriptional regulator [Steroidobacter sp.]|uniref:LuxR C-terminal-related transcriptional regulator n=1 Tax=Steroidobacter sp. TaxID=1978227 RepID=UPI002ED7FDB0
MDDLVSAPPILAKARLVPPANNIVVLERPALFERIEQHANAQLILVEAPAGFGKTLLLELWRRRRIEDGACVAWLTLDESDADAGNLLDDIADALRAAGLCWIDPRASDSTQRLRTMLDSIAAAGQSVVLLLDEFEHAGAAAAAIEPLLRRAPSNLQVAIAGRVRPVMRIAALRARGLVVTLTAGELRLRSEEIARMFDCKLSRKELSAVVNVSQGWPAIIELFRNARARGVHMPWAPGRILPEVTQYIEEEVLTGLTHEQCSIFQETSVLDELTEDAVAALTGSTDSWREIIECEQMRAFICVDEASGLRRLHPLLHGVLAERFASTDRPRYTSVMRAAARWYAASDQIVRAVTHALRCGDLELAATIIEAAGDVHIWIRHGKAVTMGIDALLTEPLMSRYPRIRLMRALVQVKNGRLSDARRTFEQVNTVASDDALLKFHSAVVEATLLFNECRPVGDSYLRSFELAMREAASDDHILRGHYYNLSCLSCSDRGMFDKASAAAHAAIEHYRQAGSMHGQIFEHLHLGGIAFAQGTPMAAKAAYARARELTRRFFGDDQTKAALLSSLCGELAYEQNMIGQAWRLSRHSAQHLARIEFWYEIYAAHFVTTALLSLDRGGLAEARSAIESARQEAAERKLVGVKRLLDATSASCLALAGEIDEAHETLVNGGLELAEYLRVDEIRTWREQEAVLVAVLRVAANSSVSSIPMATVEELLSRMWSGKNVRSAIRVGTSLACLYWSLERPAQALSHLDSVLRASHRSGYVRVFLEDRNTVLPVLESWRKSVAAQTDVAGHADTVLGLLGHAVAPATPQFSLTARESEILQEISRGRSDKEIARDLRLSENTIKFHLKNLYNKLQVGRRMDAIHEARRRGIVH